MELTSNNGEIDLDSLARKLKLIRTEWLGVSSCEDFAKMVDVDIADIESAEAGSGIKGNYLFQLANILNLDTHFIIRSSLKAFQNRLEEMCLSPNDASRRLVIDSIITGVLHSDSF